ncbi:MAG: nucleoside deaminase [Bacteroidales bacterium]|nr:nucleoside deaminase [Bacteroidales bacterium]
MPNKQTFMLEAINLAASNLKNGNGGPFGAVVVKNGEIIGKGSNTVTSSNDPTAHAEINAIRDACKNLGHFQLDGCEIYSSCEPCPMCMGAIYWARPAKLFFAANRKDAEMAGFDDSKIYQELRLDFNEREIPNEQMLRNEALEVFEKWNQLDNKIQY